MLCFSSFLLFCSLNFFADDPLAGVEMDSPDRPKVGLVLSGGAALGASHVGVLKELERLNVPVDYIAGTSMGAIVGGMYAMGMSADEIEKALEEIDWQDLFRDEPPRRERLYRAKVDENLFPARIEVGLKGGKLVFPPGLIIGNKLMVLLQRTFFDAHAVDNFDDLPIPFRAVATDLETGELVVLGKGSLSESIRASMSLPAIFAPVLIEDRLLVDGGVVRNLPVDVVREMGADIVIAVDVRAKLDSVDELNSIGKMTGQLISLVIRNNMEQSVENADLAISPDMEGFNGAAFENAVEMIKPGVEATRAKESELKKVALSPEAYQRFREQLTVEPLKPLIGSIQVNDSVLLDRRSVLRQLPLQVGDRLELEKLEQGLNNLYRMGHFELVTYSMKRLEDGSYQLVIDARMKRWGPHYLRFGFDLFSNFSGESSFNLRALLRSTLVRNTHSEYKVAASLGDQNEILGEFYQPFSYRRTWFTALTMNSAKNEIRILNDDESTALIDIWNVGGALTVGRDLDQYGEFRVGISANEGNLDSESDNVLVDGVAVDEIDISRVAYMFSLDLDQLDSVQLPRNGWAFSMNYLRTDESLGSDKEFSRLDARWAGAATFGRYSFNVFGNYFSGLGSDLPIEESFTLGGLFRLSGYIPDSLVGRYGGNVGILAFREFFESPFGGAYIGVSAEAGNMWGRQAEVDSSDFIYSGSIFLTLDSVLGPVNLAYGFADSGENSLYLLVGRTF